MSYQKPLIYTISKWFNLCHTKRVECISYQNGLIYVIPKGQVKSRQNIDLFSVKTTLACKKKKIL